MIDENTAEKKEIEEYAERWLKLIDLLLDFTKNYKLLFNDEHKIKPYVNPIPDKLFGSMSVYLEPEYQKGFYENKFIKNPASIMGSIIGSPNKVFLETLLEEAITAKEIFTRILDQVK